MTDGPARELQRLRDRVQELEEILGLSEDEASLIGMVVNATPAECRVLGLLRKRIGGWSRSSLYTALYGDRRERDQPDIKILDVFVARLRKNMKPIGLTIETIHGVGFRMPELSRARLAEKIADLAHVQ